MEHGDMGMFPELSVLLYLDNTLRKLQSFFPNQTQDFPN